MGCKGSFNSNRSFIEERAQMSIWIREKYNELVTVRRYICYGIVSIKHWIVSISSLFYLFQFSFKREILVGSLSCFKNIYIKLLKDV